MTLVLLTLSPTKLSKDGQIILKITCWKNISSTSPPKLIVSVQYELHVSLPSRLQCDLFKWFALSFFLPVPTNLNSQSCVQNDRSFVFPSWKFKQKKHSYTFALIFKSANEQLGATHASLWQRSLAVCSATCCRHCSGQECDTGKWAALIPRSSEHTHTTP